MRHVNKLMTSATYIFIFGICKLSIYFYIHMRICMVGKFRVGTGRKKKTIICIADGFYKYTRFRRMIYTVKILALL